jgi:hypothetical protein
MKPSIGRIVWYYSNMYLEGQFPLAAIVAFVHPDDRILNLGVFSSVGAAYPATAPLLQKGETPTVEEEASGYCTWMPYQIAVHEKDAITV